MDNKGAMSKDELTRTPQTFEEFLQQLSTNGLALDSPRGVGNATPSERTAELRTAASQVHTTEPQSDAFTLMPQSLSASQVQKSPKALTFKKSSSPESNPSTSEWTPLLLYDKSNTSTMWKGARQPDCYADLGQMAKARGVSLVRGTTAKGEEELDEGEPKSSEKTDFHEFLKLKWEIERGENKATKRGKSGRPSNPKWLLVVTEEGKQKWVTNEYGFRKMRRRITNRKSSKKPGSKKRSKRKASSQDTGSDSESEQGSEDSNGDYVPRKRSTRPKRRAHTRSTTKRLAVEHELETSRQTASESEISQSSGSETSSNGEQSRWLPQQIQTSPLAPNHASPPAVMIQGLGNYPAEARQAFKLGREPESPVPSQSCNSAAAWATSDYRTPSPQLSANIQPTFQMTSQFFDMDLDPILFDTTGLCGTYGLEPPPMPSEENYYCFMNFGEEFDAADVLE